MIQACLFTPINTYADESPPHASRTAMRPLTGVPGLPLWLVPGLCVTDRHISKCLYSRTHMTRTTVQSGAIRFSRPRTRRCRGRRSRRRCGCSGRRRSRRRSRGRGRSWRRWRGSRRRCISRWYRGGWCIELRRLPRYVSRLQRPRNGGPCRRVVVGGGRLLRCNGFLRDKRCCCGRRGRGLDGLLRRSGLK